MVLPFIIVAAIIRTIDAVKAFDTIFVITLGRGRATASETINPLPLHASPLPSTTIGYASAMVGRLLHRSSSAPLLPSPLHAAGARNGRDAMEIVAGSGPVGAPRPAGAGLVGRILFALSVIVIVLAGGAGVPVDAVAVAEERDRQHRLPRRSSSPTPPTLSNFRSGVPGQARSCSTPWNSVIVTGSATLMALLVGRPGRLRPSPKAGAWRVRHPRPAVRALTPGLSFLIPLFILFKALGLTGTLWPQIITHLVITVPIVAWVMIGFFETIPHELEEAAADRRLPRCGQAFPPHRPAAGAAGDRRLDHPLGDLLVETTSSSASCSPGRETRNTAGRRLQRAVVRATVVGTARRGGTGRHPAGFWLLTHLRANARSSPGLAAGGVKGG